MESAPNGKALLERLRSELTAEQRKLLTENWVYYCSNHCWIPTKVAHASLGRAAVRAIAGSLGGSIIQEHRTSGRTGESYELTGLGILLTDEGPALETELVRYLGYLVERYHEKPILSNVTSDEVGDALGLDGKQLTKLFALLHWHGWRWSFGGGVQPETGKWYASMPKCVDELAEETDLAQCVHEEIARSYDSALPVWVDKRLGYSLRKQKAQESREFEFVLEHKLRKQLVADREEARAVFDAKAWKSCVILCGGIVEGMLLSALQARRSEIVARHATLNLQKEGNDPEDWTLGTMVRVAVKLDIIRAPTFHWSEALREHRNLIHPARHVGEGVEIGERQARIALDTVDQLMEELSHNPGGR